ncbi:MFS transporter [Sphingomonas sp. ID0503]|uniref:MFS transporter n=1 Tax=Sphingomonas sp. ID0503 TaxID=3399691 RepID=UPI003AFA0834
MTNTTPQSIDNDDAPTEGAAMKFPDYVKYGIGMVGNQIMRDVPSSLLLFYMTNTLLISPALAGFAILVPKLWVIVADPLVGMLSDKTRGRWGPRKPYLFAGSIFSALMFVLMFTVPMPASPLLATLLIGACYLLLSTGYSLYSVPYLTLAADLGRTQRERTLALAYKHFFCLAGVVIALGIAPWLVSTFGQDKGAYGVMSAVLGMLLFVTTMTTTVLVPVRQADPNTPPMTGNLLSQMIGAFDHRPFRIVFTAATLQLLGFGVNAAMGLYFTIYIMKMPLEVAGLVATVSVVGAVVSQPLWVRLATRCGTIPAYRIATISAAISSTLILLVPAGALAPYLALGFVGGMTTCGFTMMSFSSLIEAIALDGPDSNRKALFASAYTAMEKAMLAVGGFLTAMILSLSGFIQGADAQPAQVMTTIVLANVAFPSTLKLLSLFVLARYEGRPPPARHFEAVIEAAE